ncbi:sporulation protein YqfD [Paenibacillus alvei]|uniref:Sporulation protein YqfD n=1 Tax=Paenibacillus alvei TaxID=44250 RepID=A0ABT4GUA5_PAEAL|nr:MULTISPECIES: sporulation protein YqfD [Paenibacillus]MCY7486983.1 sporulation protein YqfD [Paenibacillus alvei]MCY9540127.1 sporulation protein YqfD [Paenibacillus alvei]MCY9705665.1 sporulation protein YqfD [Paenibacillus alvei]MCY9734899.1 sporulation protein YqfD [Paenibacillus alvei]MCY9757814.1 sporulation protein YqfD [Paenibacillus alvei]
MKAPVLAHARGYVRVRIRGGSAESFINSAVSSQIQVWDVQRTSFHDFQCYVLVSDYFKLKPILKQTGCRVHVEQRMGLPFTMRRVLRRKFFLIGFAFFMLGLYMLSSLVWSIEVKGNVRIPTEQVLAAAKEQGIYPFQWTFRLRDPDVIAKAMHTKLKEASWIGVNWEGTRVAIQVIEATKPDALKLVNPRHIVASADAVVTDIIAENGRAVVARNARVKKGDVLISGAIGNETEPKDVVAKGEVRGLVWHQYEISSPLVMRHKVYTGEEKERKYIVTGSRRLMIAGFGDIPYAHYELLQEDNTLRWRQLSLPIGWMIEKIKEVQFASEERTAEQASEAGLKQARADVLGKNGPNARIHSEKILHQKTDNGKVVMKVLFEVEQSIAEELPLVRQFEQKSQPESEPQEQGH